MSSTVTPLPLPPKPPPGGPPPPTTATPNVTAVRAPNDGVEQDGGEAFGRMWKLSIGPASGAENQSLDLSLLDFEFSVDQTLNHTPWVGRIKIWNVGPNIIQRMNKELTNVRLDAGYRSPSNQYGKVFAGQIDYFKAGKQDAVDTFVEIWAFTKDTGINAAIVNTWLPAGSKTVDAINALVAAMQPFGITLGQLPPDLDPSKKPRGRLMFGMARDYLRDVERTEHGKFLIDQEGKLHFLRDSESLKMGNETVPILNKNTGLIGVPTTTLDGAAEVQCLLNPNITPGTRIKINNDELAKIHKGHPDELIDDAYRLSMTDFNFNANGLYHVGHVRHQGQNRGNPWFTQITTQKIDQQPGITTSASGA